ncbi:MULTISPECIES: MoaD/ThiS family protein [unclassified Microcoleus]|uniref:MoaD/ThiS family protein n=1 Tax=unclassified Microcoleus TaxID=2642155 RepID=UPI00403F4330
MWNRPKSLLSENGATSQIDRTRLGINQEFATRDTPLQNCDEVVLIPPVSSPLLPSDSPPMAISLSPGGRSS